MRSNYRFTDPNSYSVDLDDEFTLKDTWLDGNLYVWGKAITSSGTIFNVLFPIKSDTTYAWRTIAIAGGTSIEAAANIGIKTNGTLWSWGDNRYGQLGLGDSAHRATPVQIGIDVDWVYATAGFVHVGALRKDGTIWVWGLNGSGELGLGDTVHRSSPVQLGSRTDWKLINFSYNSSAAITSNGDLWVWGDNFLSALGTGNTTYISSPVQIGSGTKWKQVNFQIGLGKAISTTNHLWVWGRNDAGQLGISSPDLIRYSTPVQVGTDFNWKVITGAHALRSDGSLWAWGRNTAGQLGLGDLIPRSSPTQVGSLTDWKNINSTQDRHAIAIKKDGSLWAWGRNDNGQLGLDDTVHRSSPVQIGSSLSWKIIPQGTTYNASAAILDVTNY